MAQEPVTAADAARLAQDALASGAAGDAFARTQGRLLAPVAIRTPGGGVWGWMVPVAQADKLLGFVQVDVDGLVHRYASFQRQPGDLSSCPAVAAWTDPDVIRQRAAAEARPEETLAEPVLTYDRSPDRLYWAVAATTAARARVIAVAGDVVWSPVQTPE